MVWYPNGLRDEKNNYPIFRKWITASHPAVDFNSQNIWLVDMACFPWSSWSPIFILNEGSFNDKSWTLYVWNKLIFLWILFSWPVYYANWDIVIEDIPTQQKISTNTSVMMNLWYYIKSIVILDFKEEIINRLKKQ